MALSTTRVEDVELHITYVDKEGPFLKLFAQTDKNGHLVERLLYQLRDLLETKDELKPKTLSDVKVGLVCCTKYTDNIYYRAKIQSLSNLRDHKVTVYFIDYGNRAEVNVTDIRLNSNLISIFPDERVKKILELPNLAREFFVAGIAARGEWDDQLLESLRSKLNNTEVLCSVCEVGGKKVIYKIHKADIDIIVQLINTNAGFEIPFNTFIKKIGEMKPAQVSLPNQFNVPPPTLVDLTRQPPLTRMPNFSQPPPIRMMSLSNQLISGRPGSIPGVPGIPVRRPELPMTVHPPSQSLQFSTDMLAVGVTHPVYVSHVEDGPHSFAIQIQSEVQNVLIKMMTDINNHTPQPITAPLNPGSICLGRYSQDNSLCRAIVMNVIDDKVKLYFADFGNSEILPYSEIYEIPPQFVKPKVVSHRFTLADIKDVYYTDEQKLLFKRLVANSGNLQIRVAPPEANPLKQYCDLFLKCKNIKLIMEEMFQSMPPLRYVPPQLPKKGSHVKVFVPFVLNPGRFFVQQQSSQADLREVMSQVANHCLTASHIPLTNLRAGDPCCALYEDETWYRAEILKVNPEKAFINFVDYGNQEEVEHTNLRMIAPDLVTKTRAQALVCCLKGYEMRYNVSEETSNRLEELILEKNLTMHVLGSTECNVLIVEMSDNGQDIGTLLDATPVHNTTAVPKTTPPVKAINADLEETPQTAPSSNTWEEPKYSDARGPSDDGGKSWRSQQDSNTSRFNRGERRNDEPHYEKRYNKEEEDKPWSRGEGKFNKADNQGGRFNRDEDGGRFNNRDDGKRFGERKGRFNDEDKGGKYGDTDSRGRRFNSTDDDKPWKKRDEGGSWKDRENSDKGWKDRDGGSGGGWKGRDGGSGGGWQNGGGDRKSRFDGDRGQGGFNRDFGDRSSQFRGGGGDSFRKPAPKSLKPESLGGIPYPTPKVGMIENTQVVFSTSPVEFYVQLNSSSDELNQLMDKIAAACESGEAIDMADVQDKVACLAQYSEDNTWYRGFIEENEFDTAKVLFVDYGNQENVPHNKIKTLPEDMSSLPAQAVKCRLYGVPETSELDPFSDLTAEKTLQTQFVAKHFLTKSFQVVMIDEESGTNINIFMGAEEEEVSEALSKIGLTSPTLSRYPPGTSLTVQMTWYLNPSHFYIQPLASHPEFRAMMQSMQTIVKTGSVCQNNQLNVGDFVIARFKADKVLYRALVKESGFLPTVQYVDYGNIESVDSGSVWIMEPEFATLPVQASACSLMGVLPKEDTWPQANTTNLDLHFESETLECCVVKEAEGEVQYVVKLVKDGEDVAAKIIEEGLAIPDSDLAVSSELDSSLLIGQLLTVALIRVQDDLSFFVQPLADNAELQSLEAVAGEGIKCTITSIKEDAPKEQLEQLAQLPATTNIIILVDAVQSDGMQTTVYDAQGQLLPLQISEVSSVDKICPLPVFNRHQKVWIAHASEDGIFLHKIIFADHLSELLQKLFEFYSESEQVESEWTEGELCCAKSVNDEQWYRAKILETGSDTKVQYIDYGNSETLPVSNLRILDSAFYTPYAFALKVNFHVSWNVPMETLLELAGETEYNAVLFRSGNSWIAELVDTSGQCLTDKLVELGFAVALENSPFKRVVEGGRFVEGSDMSVSPTFIDSPLQLWVCVGDDIELVEALQDRLQDAAPKLVPLKEPNGMFAAKYLDQQWYRAVKLNDTTVRFVDYGNSDIFDMNDIKELSADFLEPAEGYAVKVELPLANFKEDATERLNQLLLSDETELEGEIMAHILFVNESYIVADISKGGRSVVDILVGENLCTRLQGISSGYVSHINSIDDFFIQEVGCEESLETISNIMLTAEDFEPISEIEIGNLVGALSTEGVWYRAEVIENTENGVLVLFVDYGNSAVASKLRRLPPDLAARPYLAKHCTLQLPSCVNEWTQAAVDKFVEQAADGCTQFDVKYLNNESPITVSLTSSGLCISEELKSLCDVAKTEIVTTENTSIDYSGYDTTVFISHFNSTRDFYVQTKESEAELDSIKEGLSDVSKFEVVDQMTDEVNKEILGALFVEDKIWYRAKVIDTVDGVTQVLFIDYGNTAVATDFVKLPDTLSSKLPVAIHSKLEKEDWPEEADEYICTLCDNGNTPFRMKIIKEGNPQTISLIAHGKIVEKELDQLSKEDNINFNNSPQETSSDKAFNEIIKTVYLIQVNSPDDFFLQTAEATQQMPDITDQLVGAENFLQVEMSSVTIGQIVAAQFDEGDLWYRAKIIDKSETEIKALFIDYGNRVNVANIKHLPEELLSIPPLVMHCSLQRPGGNQWSQEALATFNKLANDEGVTFDLRIISEGEPNIVDLYINGESIVEQLILVTGLASENHSSQESEDLPNNVHSDKPSTGSEVVEISHYNDPEDFYVQFLDEKDQLSYITNELSQADNFEAMLDMDDMLAAKYKSDQLWYRAKILDTNASDPTVLFVDHGNSDTASEFRKLPKHLAEKKPLAKHCRLKSPRGNWSEETKDKLSILAKLEDLTFEIKVVKDGDPCVVDLFVNGRSLADTFSAEDLSHTEKDIQQIVLQSVDKVISSSHQNYMTQIADELICSVEDKIENQIKNNEDRNAVDLCMQQDMRQTADELVSSVEDKIENQIKNDEERSAVDDLAIQQDMRQIAEELVCSVEDKIENQIKNDEERSAVDDLAIQQDMRQIAEELVCSVEDKIENQIKNDEERSAVDDLAIQQDMRQIADELVCSVEEKFENLVKDNEERSACDFTVEEKREDDVMAASNATNGVGKEADENEEIISENKVQVSDGTQNKVCTGSPSAYRRKNIDEQIVPGCISIKPDDLC